VLGLLRKRSSKSSNSSPDIRKDEAHYSLFETTAAIKTSATDYMHNTSISPSNNQVAINTESLNKLYVLEDVDIKTVRKLSRKSENKPANKKKSYTDLSAQLPLDFGDCWRDWVEPFFVQEPVESLNLSLKARNALTKCGFSTIQHLINADISGLIAKGILGQGHADEVQEKLSHYINGRDVQKSYLADFESLVHTLIAKIDKKDVYPFLSKYQLEHLISHPSLEFPSLKSSASRLQESIQSELFKTLQNDFDLRKRFEVSMDKIVKAFVLPWIRGRLGLATKDELLDRLTMVSENTKTVKSILELLKDLFWRESTFILDPFLFKLEDDLYCSDQFVKDLYQEVLALTKSYFYSPYNAYSIVEIVRFLQRDLVRQWKLVPVATLEKILILSPVFYNYKDSKGILQIKL
jgi:hypothetical protein